MPIVKRSTKRREEILQSLAFMLESEPGEKITTARLAAHVGVSEAALYRHFPSKARMFEGLIAFAEESLFARINAIAQSENSFTDKLQQIMTLMLAFADKNPGIARVLSGDVLVGEKDWLRQRVDQVFNRVEVLIKQVMRQEMTSGFADNRDPSELSNLLLAIVEGKIRQFARSQFSQSPLAGWKNQWQQLEKIFV